MVCSHVDETPLGKQDDSSLQPSPRGRKGRSVSDAERRMIFLCATYMRRSTYEMEQQGQLTHEERSTWLTVW